MKCWFYAIHILPLLWLAPQSFANVTRSQSEIQRELGEIGRLSEALQELCTRLAPEIDNFHIQVAKEHAGADSRIRVLRPISEQLSQKELTVEKLRTEQARTLAHANALNFVSRELPKGPKSFLQAMKHRMLLISQKQIPEQRDLVETTRSQLASLEPETFETRADYLQMVAKLRQRLDQATYQLFQLSFESDWLNEIYRDRVNLRISDLPSRKALVEGQLGLFRNQLSAEEMSVRNLRERATQLEKELGEKSSYAFIPPFLPAVCSRVR